jgi:ABC-type multidrug transport system fused ATPase/permease subunit
MNVRPDIAEFVANLEAFGNRKMNYPMEVGEILQIAFQTGLINEFEELVFHAKFLTRAQDVMKHIGYEAEGFEKLSTEFQLGIQKSTDVLKMVVGRASEDVILKYSDTFFATETDCFVRLMKFYSDLSWIKNWQIDGKPLPYEQGTSKTTIDQKRVNRQIKEKQQNQSSKSLSRIQRSAMLGVILFVLFLFIDPPVTILGWLISLWIAALLVYIIVQMFFIRRNSNSHRTDE